MRLSQTSIIAASMMVAFLVFITVRGELPAYLAIFTGKKGTAPATGGPSGKGAGFELPGGINIDIPFIEVPKIDFPGFSPGFGFWPGGHIGGGLNDPNHPDYGAN